MNLPDQMQAMVLETQAGPLVYKNVPVPIPGKNQVLIKVHACGVCRTDLHILDGELKSPKLPLIPGHEIIGSVVQVGGDNSILREGMLVGVPWLGYACGKCKYCESGRENLCDNPLFTGYTIDGGYAQFTVANSAFCIQLPKIFKDPACAPLLCAGLIGYRSLKLAGENVKNIGIYGFGAAAHIITQIAISQGKKVFAFTRKGDLDGQHFAKSLGAVWADNSDELPVEKLDATLIFAPAGELIPKALQAVGKGGKVVCGGIHMSDIPSFPYAILWEERALLSVANLTRTDASEFMELLDQVPVKTDVQFFSLKEANAALSALRNGSVRGAAVLVID